MKSKPMTFVKPMLAKPETTLELALKGLRHVMEEPKYDGERGELHITETDMAMYSRGGGPMNARKTKGIFEALNDNNEKIIDAQSVIIDGELLLVDLRTGKPLPFETIAPAKKPEGSCFCYKVFDIINFNGSCMLDVPLSNRRKMLERIVTPRKNVFELSALKWVSDESQLRKDMEAAVSQGIEGLVLKDPNSTYKPNVRGWIKLKRDHLDDGSLTADTLDLIVLGGDKGTGKNTALLTTLLMGCYDAENERLLTVCKVSNMSLISKKIMTKVFLTDGTMIRCAKESLPPWLCIETMPQFVIRNANKSYVLEVKGAEFKDYKDYTAGISLRFPRIVRMRRDKTWTEATTLQQLRQMASDSAATDSISESKSAESHSSAMDSAMHRSVAEDVFDDAVHKCLCDCLREDSKRFVNYATLQRRLKCDSDEMEEVLLRFEENDWVLLDKTKMRIYESILPQFGTEEPKRRPPSVGPRSAEKHKRQKTTTARRSQSEKKPKTTLVKNKKGLRKSKPSKRKLRFRDFERDECQVVVETLFAMFDGSEELQRRRIADFYAGEVQIMAQQLNPGVPLNNGALDEVLAFLVSKNMLECTRGIYKDKGIEYGCLCDGISDFLDSLLN